MKPIQFSMRSILGATAAVAVAAALPRWIGPAATGIIVGAVVSIFLVLRFRTPGFLAGVLVAWLSVSLGAQIQLRIHQADHPISATSIPLRTGVGEIAGIWLLGLTLSFTFLAPIYLGRTVRDFYRLRSRLSRDRRCQRIVIPARAKCVPSAKGQT